MATTQYERNRRSNAKVRFESRAYRMIKAYAEVAQNAELNELIAQAEAVTVVTDAAKAAQKKAA